MGRRVRAAVLLFACAVVVPSAASAQQASITGLVRDASGAVLPGVTVEASSPALIEGVRSAVTDGSGRYAIEALRPGDYVITFMLPGFAGVRREGIEVTGTGVLTVNAEMRVGAVEETITVTAEAPTVDVQSLVRQRVLDREVLEALPSSRSPAQMAALTPNVTPTTHDVGGAMGDGSGRGGIMARGVDDSKIMISGIVTQTGTGSSHGVYNLEAYQEVVVDTGAVSAEHYTGGVRINFIPRDGGNTFSGSFLTSFANKSMAGSNFSQELKEAGLPAPNTVKQLLDVNPSFGGPIKQDRVWFYTAARYNRAFNYASVYFNKNAGNPNVWTYEPDLSREAAATENEIKNFSGRVTWQASPRNKFAAMYDTSRVCDCPRRLRSNEAPEAVLAVYNINPRWFTTVDWTSPISSRLLLEANVNHIYSDADRAHVNPYFSPSPVPLVQVQEQSTGINYRGTSNAPHSINRPWTARAVLSYVTGAHTLKFGYNFATVGQSRETFSPDAPLIYRLNNGVPNRITQYATPFTAFVDGVEHSLFAQERWSVGLLTLSGGLRYDYFGDTFPEQTIGPGNFVPNRNIVFEKRDGVKWHDIEPRVGLSYDVFGDGRTAAKVSLNKYLSGDGSGGPFGIGAAPANSMVASTTRSWADANRDYVPDCDLTNPRANGECGAMASQDFGSALSILTYDPDLADGWGRRTYNWQFSTGVQHEILPRISVGVDYWRTWFGNFVVVDHRAYDQTDFDTFSITAPSDPRLPGGGGYTISGLYDLKPAAFGRPASGLVARSDTYGKMTEHWNGVDVTFSARPAGGFLLQGGTSTGRRSTDNCEVVEKVAAEPPPDRGGAIPIYHPGGVVPAAAAIGAGSLLSPQFCHAEGTFLTQVKALASYRIPRIDVQVSASLQNLPGPEILATYTATNAVISPSLGRTLSGGATNVPVALVAPRSMYGERMNQLDLRFGKLLRFGRIRANVGVDVYNALNSNAVLAVNDAFGSFEQPIEILNARFAKFVFQVDY
jgi:carboxypeptidase family protein